MVHDASDRNRRAGGRTGQSRRAGGPGQSNLITRENNVRLSL